MRAATQQETAPAVSDGPASPDTRPEPRPNPASVDLAAQDVFQRVGALTRTLHDALRELGYARDVEQAVGSLPDARARLDYVARLTGQAAERVLTAAERAKARVGAIRTLSRQLEGRCRQRSAQADDTNVLDNELLEFLASADAGYLEIDRDLIDIILAQEFHDLTGQVIQKITRIAQTVEEQLVRLLLDSQPVAQPGIPAEELGGPLIDASGRDDVVTDQSQVDSLLESLGF